MNIKVFTQGKYVDLEFKLEDDCVFAVSLDRYELLALRIKLQNAWNKLERSVDREEVE